MKRPCQIHMVHTRLFTPVDVFMNAQAAEEESVFFSEADFSIPAPLYRDSFSEIKKAPAPPPAPTVLSTIGVFEPASDGTFHISYEEHLEDGKKSLSTFCLSPAGMLVLHRRGVNNTCFVFEDKTRHNCDYGLFGGFSSMSLQTHKLQFDFSEKGGNLFVDYSLELRGSLTEHTTIFLEVIPEP